eukprot:m.956842 g.956842  ORF g.956842 m.956842 type:complete len:627 (+) comp23875_c1_seq9:119-1999(+)
MVYQSSRGSCAYGFLLWCLLSPTGSSDVDDGPVVCAGNVKQQACFVIDGTNFTSKFHTNNPGDCCLACQKAPAQCDAWQWNYPNNTVIDSREICSLIKGAPSIKIPHHPDQTECVISMPPPPPPLPPAPPGAISVLYILVDDLRTQMTPYGHTFMHTPHLQQLADESVVFTQAHCNSQMCVPTRNSFMSGRRPDTTRVFNDGIGNANFRVIGQNWTTMPQHFKNNGYFTTGVGKTFHPNSPPNFDQPMSWSNLSEFPYDYPAVTTCPNASDVWCRIDNESAYFEDNAILFEAERRLSAAASDPSGRPFFVAVGFHKPHTPYRVPGPFFDLYPPVEAITVAKEQNFPTDQNLTGLAWFSCLAEGKQYPITVDRPYPTTVQQLLRRAYYAAVSFTDSNIGRLLDFVDTLLIADKIIVVFHADHGYQLGERNIYCKETCFDDATHVPLMIRAPMYHSGPRRVSSMVELVDIFPTLSELARIPPLDPSIRNEPALGGRSFASLVRDSAHAPPAVVSDMFNASFSQYGRSRCYDNLFVAHPCADGVAGKFIGYSVRVANYRYTRWVNVTLSGDPFWDQVIGEEFYNENVTSNDFDKSETQNIMYVPSLRNDTALAVLQAALRRHHVTSPKH